ncbi:MAG TPA: thiamine-phosphate kinase [Acidimicrobiales bacterium]|nr:thiamine-phosphate kinase [Acidimicrobiales bacterium]
MGDATGACGEFAAIARIARRFGPASPGELWIGDDAALVRVGTGLAAVAADAVVAGVHADLALTSVADLGWKAIAVNVSDLAAMGLAPGRAVVTVTAPPGTDIDALYDGIEAAATAFACPVVGGDLTEGPTLVVSVTVIADACVTPPPVRRDGARPGDVIWASGPLGAAAAALAHLRDGAKEDGAAHARPRPRTAEGVAARELGATAMIDVSDGLGADLGHVLDASGVGCALDEVPVAPGATWEQALGGGEDFELIWCAPAPADLVAAFADRGLRAPVRLGRCTTDPGARTVAGAPLPVAGWQHRIG